MTAAGRHILPGTSAAEDRPCKTGCGAHGTTETRAFAGHTASANETQKAHWRAVQLPEIWRQQKCTSRTQPSDNKSIPVPLRSHSHAALARLLPIRAGPGLCGWKRPSISRCPDMRSGMFQHFIYLTKIYLQHIDIRISFCRRWWRAKFFLQNG